MPELAKTYTVIAPDLRGVGGSTSTASGYDKANMARDVRELVRSLGLGNLYVFGHDIGGMTAYAYARSFPDELKGFGVMDVPLPSVEPWTAVQSDPRAWHFKFHEDPGLAEALVVGRQAVYFRNFYERLAAKPGAITDDEVRVFAAAYGSGAQLRAGFEWYRAFPKDEAFNAAHTEPLRVPMLLVGADKSMGPMLPPMAASLRRMGVADVRSVVIPDSGHWIAEENPGALIAAIRSFVGQTSSRAAVKGAAGR
jgi:pimeloyl-ACP methyl ester carboxylesterase